MVRILKIRLPKKRFLAIFFAILMLFSTFAYSFLQSIRPVREEVELPKENIINYELSVEQESLALRNGKTIATFYYYAGCLECSQELSFLESMARQFPDQIILEEILGQENIKSLSITSLNGQESFTNATQDQIFDAFCDIMIRPPIVCATRKV